MISLVFGACAIPFTIDAAPETISKDEITPKSDVHTLGLLVFQLLELRDNPWHDWDRKADSKPKLEPNMFKKAQKNPCPDLRPLKRRIPGVVHIIQTCLDGNNHSRPELTDIVKRLERVHETLLTANDHFLGMHFHMPRDMDASLPKPSASHCMTWYVSVHYGIA